MVGRKEPLSLVSNEEIGLQTGRTICVMFGLGRDECRLKRLVWDSDEHVGRVLV